MSNIDQEAFQDFTQSMLTYAEAEGERLNMPLPEVILGVVALATHLSVDRRACDVDHAETDVVVLAEMVGGQMREWPIEDRLLDEEPVN